LFSIVAGIVILYIVLRKDIPPSYYITQLIHPNEVIKDPFMFRLSWGILIILLIGYFVSEWVNIPVSLIAGVVAIIFLLFAKRSPAVETMTALKGAPWDIVFFSIGR